MKNIKGYTHTFWSPSKLGVAGLSPVFRSLKIKQLHSFVAAFFFILYTLSQFYNMTNYKNNQIGIYTLFGTRSTKAFVNNNTIGFPNYNSPKLIQYKDV